jgi:hypothetical protein
VGCEKLGPNPDASIGSSHWSQDSTASAYVRWDDAKIGKDQTSGKSRNRLCTGNAFGLERFHYRQNDDTDHDDSWHLVDYSIEFLRMPIGIGGESLHPARKQSVQRRQ